MRFFLLFFRVWLPSALCVRVYRGDCPLPPHVPSCCHRTRTFSLAPLPPLSVPDADVCWIKGDVLEAARRAFGTDEDIIAVAPADGLLFPSVPRPPPPLAARGGAAGAHQQQQEGSGPRPAVSPGATVFASTVTTTGRP